MPAKLKIPKKYAQYLRIGTSNWKYDSWKGLVYDPARHYDPADYLADYARCYNTVEIDQWFWSLFPMGNKLPKTDDVRAYADSVPEDFLFTVKVPNSITLTHHYAKQTKAYAASANQPNAHFLDPALFAAFLERLEPMGQKLGPVLFQFEYLNKQKMPSLTAFLEALHAFFEKAPKGYRYAIECRNPNYLKPEFFAFLVEHGLGFVLLDGYYMPPVADVTAAHDVNTAGFTIVRLHGKGRGDVEAQKGDHWNRIIEDRGGDLKALAGFLGANLDKKILTLVNVSNHYEGSAPLTIQRLTDVLFA